MSGSPSTGSSTRCYLSAPGPEIDPSHPLVDAIETSDQDVFGQVPERGTVHWFSDASALSRYGIPSVNYGTSSGLPDAELGEYLDIEGLVQMARVYALAAVRVCGEARRGMRLVTFDDGKVGALRGRPGGRSSMPPTCARSSSEGWTRRPGARTTLPT